MKRLFKFLLILTAPTVVFGVSGPVTVVNETGLAYNNTYPVNLNGLTTGGNKFAAQVTSSSDNVTAQTFTDGQQSTGSFTVTTTNGLIATQATDKITVASDSVIQSTSATDTLVVNSTNGLNGATVSINGNVIANNGWRVDLASNTAADIATQMTASVNQIVATSIGSTVTFRASTTGIIGNSYTLATSTPTALTASSTTFTGGHGAAFTNQYITVNGNNYYHGFSWGIPNTGVNYSTATAASLATFLNSVAGIQASAAGSVVYATATVAGVAGNAFTITSSTSALTILTPTFTGGIDTPRVSIGGVIVTVSTAASTTLIAANIVSAINANTQLAGFVRASNVSNVVTTTSTAVGFSTTYALLSSTPAAITASGPFMTGGTNSAYTINSATIALPSHGFSKAMPVLYSGTPAITGLTTGTTYYVVPINANAIQLSSTSAVAQTGVGIVLTSSSTQTSAHTYTLAPLVFSAGSAGGLWQVSNDGINWAAFSTTAGSATVTSQTFTATPTTVIQDFGIVDFGYLRYNVTAPTTGGLALKVILNAKD